MILYPLSDLSVFQVSGADAVGFLQGQITNDIAGTDSHSSCLAGYCTAQGRLLGTVIFMHTTTQTDDVVMLGLIKKDILAPVLKRLSMFVMRAKAKFEPSARQVWGVSIGAEERADIETALGLSLPRAAWDKSETLFGTWVCAPATQEPRWWLIATEAQHAALQSTLAVNTSTDTAHWHALDIAAGLPWIEAATQDLFIPQTLNLDLIQGVSFTKGCYPGQEIVARSHYRGTLKRRMVYASTQFTESDQAAAEAALKPGADVFDGTRENQACGRIINIARTGATEAVLLLESSFEGVDHQQLRGGHEQGPALVVGALPYSIRPALTK